MNGYHLKKTILETNLTKFRLYSGNRLEVLAEKLAEIISKHPLPPLVRECIVVQSRGMERWVRMELARYHGICANIGFPFPDALISDLFCETFKDLPDPSPFDPSIMTWKIMKVLPSCIKSSKFETIRSYLGDPPSHLKWFQLSEQVADIFDQYQFFRPEMILKWDQGKEDHWQAILWRELTKGVGKTHRAALKADFLSRSNKAPLSLKNFPPRISIFGVPTLPAYYMDILRAVSEVIEVNLFLMNPCEKYWADIVSDRDMKRYSEPDMATSDFREELYLERGNSLLASMGALSRDFLSLVSELDCREQELFIDVPARDMLSCIQSDILLLRDRGRKEDNPLTITGDDGSVEIHSCHSPMREMEVLKDNLLSMFEKDRGLEPVDILVMAPDIEEYAPFIEAVFGTEDNERKRLPFNIADRSLKSENRIAGTFLSILDLQEVRFGASEVLSLLECPLIRNRFDLLESDLPKIRKWVKETGIRWGIDSNEREKLGLPDFNENTWRFGLDRLLLGYAMPEQDDLTFNGILPYNNIEGSDAATLGKFVDFVENLFSYAISFEKPGTIREWSDTLTDLLERFFLPDDREVKEYQVIRQILCDLGGHETDSGFHNKVELSVIKAYLKRPLEKTGPGSGFIMQGITFCSMLPMRSIPFKVICLAGMDCDKYPRQARTPGFDLIAKNPRRGDRSTRKDDRHLFLEALLSARKTLYISYTGQKDNSAIPPSVLVCELIDYMEDAFIIEGKEVSDHVTTCHRRQAFSPAYFQANVSSGLDATPLGQANTGNNKRLFSYSKENLEAARQSIETKKQPEPFISKGLTGSLTEWKRLDLAHLIDFFSNPAGFLLKKRLGIRFRKDGGGLDESESFILKDLDKYLFEQGLAEKKLAGLDLKTIFPAIQASGSIPLGTPGKCLYETSRKEIEEFVREIETRRYGDPLDPLQFRINPAGFDLNVMVKNIYPDCLIRYRYATLKAKDLLETWINHLTLNAFGPPDYPDRSLLICKDKTWEFSPVEEAEKIIETLLETYLDGLTRPLHFFPKTSYKYAEQKIVKGKSDDAALQAAMQTWQGNYNRERDERNDVYYQTCFGNTNPIDNEFKELALKIFEPILVNSEELS